MFQYSMIQSVRHHARKLDRMLRDELIHMYQPLKYTPCFLHKYIEKLFKKTKRYKVVIQFDQNNCDLDNEMNNIHKITDRHFGCRFEKSLSTVGCCSAKLTPDAIVDVLDQCKHVKKVFADREVKALLDVATPTVGADDLVRNGTELTGKGVNVAVIDTGIYPHADLEGRIVGFVDFVDGQEEAYDDNGHGTHCAGDVAGDGAMSDGQYQAPAPKANVIGVKVLDKMGSGSLSTVMEGVQWCIEHQEEFNIDVISMSLGSPANSSYPTEDDDPMVQVVEAAWDAGMVVCVAAGNEGPDHQTIASPGISDKVITVGAMDDRGTADYEDDDIAEFSSRGPTIYNEVKPDVVAPGVDIISLRAPNSYFDKIQKAARVGEYYTTMSGTSMATPICAGVVALMLEYNPDWTPDEVKAQLMEHAEGFGDANTYGAGLIQVDRVVQDN
ncbi:S8 family peptidase [Piscibacillus halophilus]|uniref:Serine protease AprX n=1 Tax=Piscibacillus halophilus TaxID=571933 RepID=A0A1H9IW26_9BACI|nr:S8 family peptidase [Piscibacillus halophilus]SEQ79001.1 serine protease AprX [Piscibacillus halophilus]